MSKSNRNSPRRSRASESTFSFFEFDRMFPDDETCLAWLVAHLYPDGIWCKVCQKVTTHYRIKSRPSFSCGVCGHHEHPMRGTIFEDSATSLKLWFHAVYLMSSTRCGISAKQLERELGVTYKTAWRIFHKIRSMLGQDLTYFEGSVEADEAYLGGEGRWRSKPAAKGTTGRGTVKTPVFGLAQRGSNGSGSRVYARVVPDTGQRTLMGQMKQRVLPQSMIYTDEWNVYRGKGGVASQGYTHKRINHKQGVYVDGDAHTNTIEGFWSLVKSGIRGAYHGVSAKHLQAYLDEYVFRYNHRDSPAGMFWAMLSRIEKVLDSA